MINIKSLKRINENELKDAAETAYEKSIEKAKEGYDKAAGSYHGHRGGVHIAAPWPFRTKHAMRFADAAYDYDTTRKAAKDTYNAAKQGLKSKAQMDEEKFQWAKKTGPMIAAKRAAEQKVADMKNLASSVPQTSESVTTGLKAAPKTGLWNAIKGHPKTSIGLAAGATVAGLLALQHRKKRLPEPESYNKEE